MSEIFPTSTEDEREAAVAAATLAIRRGELVVMPTDTVYGIAADAFDGDAVQRLLDAKGRGRDMPPPVLIAETAVAMALATSVPDAARELMAAFWPGPLTLICQAQPSLQMDLGETRGTIALRVPDHEAARAVLRMTGPLAVSSANRTGGQAARTAEEAYAQLGRSVSLYLDAGRVSGGEASSIVDFSAGESGVLVRAGALSAQRLREHAPDLLVPGEQRTEEHEQPTDPPDA